MIVPVPVVTMLVAAMRHMGVRMRMPVVMMVVSVAGMIVGVMQPTPSPVGLAAPAARE